MGALLLDTHVWFWLVTGEREELSSALVGRLERRAKQRPLLVSVISAWEIALLEAKGRIGFAVPERQWMEQVLDRPGFSVVDLAVAIAVESCHLHDESMPTPVTDSWLRPLAPRGPHW